jgi:hypothetical protein
MVFSAEERPVDCRARQIGKCNREKKAALPIGKHGQVADGNTKAGDCPEAPTTKLTSISGLPGAHYAPYQIVIGTDCLSFFIYLSVPIANASGPGFPLWGRLRS